MKLVYFAWVRERIGRSQEDLSLPPEVATVADMLSWLQAQGDEYAHALEHIPSIRVALDHRHVPHSHPLGSAREAALFPPMTGG